MIPLISNIQNREIHRDKADYWLPGRGVETGRGGHGLVEYMVSVWSDENVWGLDRGDSCTTLITTGCSL